MTLGAILREHFMMAASGNMFFVIYYKNKTNIKVAVNNMNIKIHQLFYWCLRDHSSWFQITYRPLYNKFLTS